MDNLLCVVEEEASEEDQASVEGDGVDSGPQGGGGRQEVAGDRAHEDDAKSHGQGTAHVQELVTGRAGGNWNDKNKKI